MESLFLSSVQKKVAAWREGDYEGVLRETRSIIAHVRRVRFLHEPQIEALETYIYLKEVAGNRPSAEVFGSLFEKQTDLLRALGVPDRAIVDFIDLGAEAKAERIEKLVREKFGLSDYPNQVYALTMGSGKTILMAAMALYEFALAARHPDDSRFAKNALVFAPDKTIIESLKEVKAFLSGEAAKVLPRELQDITLSVKYHYLESTEMQLSLVGNFNIIVSNSQKIILKTRSAEARGARRLFGDRSELERREVENARLQAIRQLSGLVVFVDEAHHSYGETMEGTLKKTRQTIDYLHGKTPLVSVVNLTGTPYVGGEMIADVVYHFGLKQGIERGILKQVHIDQYGDVRTDTFVGEVVGTFLAEYGQKRLEGRLPKIAFYAPSIEDLREDLRPKLERALAERGVSPESVLEYHTEAEENADEFRQLDTADSRKQFVLLVGKGTEGWNCKSLVAVALYRRPKSTIFVLQSTTRCLRSIGDNSTRARIFLSSENYKILDRELRSNFATSVADLNAQEQRTVEHSLEVLKHKKVKVRKVLREVVSAEATPPERIKVNLAKFRPEDHEAVVSEGGISVRDGRAGYEPARAKRRIAHRADLTFYEIAALVSRRTHVPCLAVAAIVENSGLTREELTSRVSESPALLDFLVQEILKAAYRYEETKTEVEEELELTKRYPFRISVQEGKNGLVVYRENEDTEGGTGRLGFHVNPYNFDSGDERELFRYLRKVLDPKEAIADIYFTGGATDPSHNDFYFEYWSPEKQRIARYFPDFLVETTKGRYLVVEVKGNGEKPEYEASRASYDGQPRRVSNEVFAKELGFREFQAANKNFEYHIAFNASLKQEQLSVFQRASKL